MIRNRVCGTHSGRSDRDWENRVNRFICPMTRQSLQSDHSRDQCVSASLHSAPLQLCFRAGQTSRWGKVWCSPWPSLPRRFRSAPLRCASSHTSRSEWKLRLPVMSVCGPASPFYPAEVVPHTATPAEHDRAESARTQSGLETDFV